MKYLLIFLLLIITTFSCASRPAIAELDPETGQEILQSEIHDGMSEEYDRIITLCEDVFHDQRSNILTCILFNFYAMNKTIRLYVDGSVTAEGYKDCHKAEYYFPEYDTFWYMDVLECLEEKEIPNE